MMIFHMNNDGARSFLFSKFLIWGICVDYITLILITHCAKGKKSYLFSFNIWIITADNHVYHGVVTNNIFMQKWVNPSVYGKPKVGFNWNLENRVINICEFYALKRDISSQLLSNPNDSGGPVHSRHVHTVA